MIETNRLKIYSASKEQMEAFIADNGIGMSEDFQNHVFERFAREDSEVSGRIEGTGLGMAVVRSFVELMNGTIECKSRQGAGTTFTVTFPFRLQSEEEIRAYRAETASGTGAAGPESSEPETPDFSGRRALLVEDNEMNLMIAQDILGDAGIIVETAEDGTVAVDMLKEKGPEYYDFVLMDIQMPIMNGYEATKAIRQMYPDAGLPIIAVSANAFAEDREASVAAGMNDHIAKPIDIRELFASLAKYL